MKLSSRVRYIADRLDDFITHLNAESPYQSWNGPPRLVSCQNDFTSIFPDRETQANRQAVDLLNEAMLAEQNYTVADPKYNPTVKRGSVFAFIGTIDPGDNYPRTVQFQGLQGPWKVDLVSSSEPQVRLYTSNPSALRERFNTIVSRATSKATQIDRHRWGAELG